MDILFNYFKPYIMNECKNIGINELISGVKYLIKSSFENETTFYIGVVFKNLFRNCLYFNYYVNKSLPCISFFSNNDSYFYELASDFSYDHCNDLFQTHYFIHDTFNIINSDCIYVIKNNYIICMSNKLNDPSYNYDIINNIWNPFLNDNYKLKLFAKNSKIELL